MVDRMQAVSDKHTGTQSLNYIERRDADKGVTRHKS